MTTDRILLLFDAGDHGWFYGDWIERGTANPHLYGHVRDTPLARRLLGATSHVDNYFLWMASR